MESNNKLQEAFKNFQNELKNAILNETANIEYIRSKGDYYKGDLIVKLNGSTIRFATSPTGVWSFCDMGLMKNTFVTPEEIGRLEDIICKHIKPLTDEDNKRIEQLEDEIERIKKGID